MLDRVFSPQIELQVVAHKMFCLEQIALLVCNYCIVTEVEFHFQSQ